MKRILTLFCLVTMFIGLNAQITFEKTFSKAGETIANDVQQTSDGGYIIVGTTEYAYGSSGDILLIKTNAYGDTSWTKMFGGFAAEVGNSVLQTFEGGYIVAGSTNSFGAGGTDAYLIKTDANGDIEWNKTIGTVGNDAAFGIVQLADSSYVFSGNELTYGINGYAHLVKTDLNGNVIWSKTYGNKLRKNYVFAMQQTSDNGFIMGGYENNYLTTNDEFSLIKADADGNMEWYKSYGDLNYEHNFSVCETADGGFAIAGINFELPGYNYDANLLKTDALGNLLWTKSYGGAGHEDVYAVTSTSDNGFVFAGSSSTFSGYQNGYITRTDSVGNVIWSKTMSGTGYDIFFSVKETTDGGFVFAGVKDEVYGVSGNLFFAKTDADGNTPCNQTVSGYTIIPPTITGTLLMNGTSTPFVNTQTPDIRSGLTETSLCCEIPSGLFASNISANKARLNWSVEPGAVKYEVWTKKTTGMLWKIKFVPGYTTKLNQKNLKCNTSYDWKIRTICDTVGADQVSAFSEIQTFTTLACREGDFTIEDNLSVYPNPATNQFTIECLLPENTIYAFIRIYDLNGNMMYQNQLAVSNGEFSEIISTEHFPSGIYFVKLVSDNFIHTERIVISK